MPIHTTADEPGLSTALDTIVVRYHHFDPIFIFLSMQDYEILEMIFQELTLTGELDRWIVYSCLQLWSEKYFVLS